MAPAAKSQSTALKSSPYAYGGSRNQDDPRISAGIASTAGGAIQSSSSARADSLFIQNIETLEPITVQGGALKTWSFPDASIERLMVSMSANDYSLAPVAFDNVSSKEGRLMHALVYLCEGPDNTPMRMEIKSGKGKYRPFKCAIETPWGHSSLFIRNIGEMEFPITAAVGSAMEGGSPDGLMDLPSSLYEMSDPRILQGGSIISFPLEPAINLVKVVLKTDGRPLNAKIELVQGPNAEKVMIDLYTEDGSLRPFYTVIASPGQGNTLRIINTASVEFPLTLHVEPFDAEL